MAVKQLALSPVQWMVYFEQKPEVFHELIDCQLQLEEAQEHSDRMEPLQKGAAVLHERLPELEEFQNNFSRHMGSTLRTEPEMRENLLHILRGDATATARRTGAANMRELVAAKREQHATKPDVSGMTPEAGKLAITQWEQEQRDLETEANRVAAGSTASSEAAGEKAATEMVADMDRGFSLDKIKKIIQLANQILAFLTGAGTSTAAA